MSEKRRDNKGRILKTGENQRKDLTYQYRFTDADGKRQTVYAPTLQELREKEKDIQRKLEYGLCVSKGKTPLSGLLKEFLDMKHNLRASTRASYESVLRRLTADPFGSKPISSIKPIEAKKWFIRLSEEGYAYGTMVYYRSILHSAYTMAIENEYVIKSPFTFRLDFLRNNTRKKEALTKEQQKVFFEHLQSSRCYSKYYDMCVILTETGIRVGEMCGLTIKNVDLRNRCITIDHQIVRMTKDSRHIAPPKSDAGYRIIPLTPKAEASIRNLIRNHKAQKIEDMNSGRGYFLFVSRNGKPYCSSMIDHIFSNIRNDYYRNGVCLPEITPHTLRHTFCTNLINSGMPPKHVQYLMGHNDVDITLNVYTSVGRDEVMESMKNLSLIT